MDIKKEIENIISEYESKLKTVFIKVIDETITYARNNNYSSINTYLLVYDKIEEMLRCISTNLGYSSKDKYALSQTFIEEIYNYINPLYLDAEEEIRNKALDLHDILVILLMNLRNLKRLLKNLIKEKFNLYMNLLN